MSYSQNYEERHILEAVGEKTGTFLDIGAYDGKTFSNTLALAERGWSGVLVEPSASAFCRLAELHGSNDRMTLVQALVGANRGIIPFWNTKDAVSTTRREHYDLWKETAVYTHRSYVPQVTIEDLWTLFPPGGVDVVSIDAEGTSYELFLNFPFNLLRPKVICVETDGIEQEMLAFAESRSYALKYHSNENMVFVR